MHWRRKWQPTPWFLPGESQGWHSLVGCCLWVTQSRTRLKQLSSNSRWEGEPVSLRREGASHTVSGGRSLLSQGRSKCKGPEARTHQTYLRKSKEASDSVRKNYREIDEVRVGIAKQRVMALSELWNLP